MLKLELMTNVLSERISHVVVNLYPGIFFPLVFFRESGKEKGWGESEGAGPAPSEASHLSRVPRPQDRFGPFILQRGPVVLRPVLRSAKI